MRLFFILVFALFLASCGEIIGGNSSKAVDKAVVTEMGCSAAQFSPDSRYIAWGGEKFKGLFVKDLVSGTVTKISDADSAGWKFSWAPDSSGIAFRENIMDRSKQIFRIQKRMLAKDSNDLVGEFEHSIWPPLWRDSIYSVDTVRISNISLAAKPAMSLKTTANSLIYNAFTSSNSVSVIDIKTGRLVINFNEGTHSPAISPDGRSVLYIELDTIKVYDIFSAKTVIVGRGSSASWAGNSKIVYNFTTDNNMNITYSEVRLFDIKDNKFKIIAVNPDKIPLFPSISSDGSKLIYTDNVSGHLFIRNLKDQI
ncbi:MAG TPA: hypothetical protein PLZ43_07340 [bacterium]|nr:hypothetical protein [bacterium]